MDNREQLRRITEQMCIRDRGYIDTCVLVLCAMLVIALAVKVLPVYVRCV